MATLLNTHSPYDAFDRNFIARIIFTLIFCSFVYSFLAGTLLHQLEQPVLKHPYVDLTYWVFHLLHIPEFIIQIAGIFDLLLILTCILIIIYPGKRALIRAFTILYFIYFITYNTFGTHHTSNKIGILLLPAAFAVRNITSFNLLWQGLRYLLLFAMTSAFFWKFFRFSWLHAAQGVSIVKKNLAPHLYYFPSGFYHWLIDHPQLVQVLFVTGMLLEGVFLIGFFTKKFDRWLFAALTALVIGFRIMADAHFPELLIWGLTLVNFHYFTKKRKKGETTPVSLQA